VSHAKLAIGVGLSSSDVERMDEPVTAQGSGVGRSSIVADTLYSAIGRIHRDDPIDPSTGGPAGNARLTAWTGLLLLVLSLAELVTLLDSEV
jgi:hypothetical protein